MLPTKLNIVLVTGGFDPLHSGHIAYFDAACRLGDMLVVGLNSDEWLIKKKGNYFMSWQDRYAIISNLCIVDRCIKFDDSDGTAIDAIEQLKKMHPNAKIIFANGGDRDRHNIPEMTVEGVTFAFGCGGDTKLNSSSDLLKRWVDLNA